MLMPLADPFRQSSSQSSLEVLTRSMRDEGLKFLFKGWTPAFIRLGPNTVLMFVFFEVRSLCLSMWVHAASHSAYSNLKKAGEPSSLCHHDP